MQTEGDAPAGTMIYPYRTIAYGDTLHLRALLLTANLPKLADSHPCLHTNFKGNANTPQFGNRDDASMSDSVRIPW